MEYPKIIKGSLIENFLIGDQVKMDIPVARGQYTDIPNDVVGTVIGFGRIKLFICRNNALQAFYDHGEYSVANKLLVKFGDKFRVMKGTHMELVTNRPYPSKEYQDALLAPYEISAGLPVTRYMEGNLVELDDGRIAQIDMVNYFFATRPDKPLYQVDGEWVAESKINKLVKRGPTYEWWEEEKSFDEVDFESLHDMAKWLITCGYMKRIDLSGKKLTTPDEAKLCKEQGLIDYYYEPKESHNGLVKTYKVLDDIPTLTVPDCYAIRERIRAA
jgi:hypothetical protein